MPVFYAEAFTRVYRARWCSRATLYAVIALGLALILPFILAYGSSSFWLKASTFREQPTIIYKRELVLLVDGLDSSTTPPRPFSIAYSTNPSYNSLFQDQVRVPILRTSEIDTNRDNKNDYLDFHIRLPLKPTESVNYARLALSLHYELIDNPTRLSMSSIAFISESHPLPSTRLDVTGDIVFSQRKLLQSKSAYASHFLGETAVNTGYEDVGVWNFTVASEAGDLKQALGWEQVLGKYMARDYRTQVDNKVSLWKTGAGSDHFIFTGRLYYSPDTFTYQPTLSEILKFSWIQYLSILTVFIVVGIPVWGWAFRNRVVDAYVSVDASVSRLVAFVESVVGANGGQGSGSGKSFSGVVPAWKGTVF